MGEATHHVQAEFEPAPGEAPLRPGSAPERPDELRRPRRGHVPAQHRGRRARSSSSSRGYGMLWDNTSHTQVRRPRSRPCTCRRPDLFDARARPGGLTGTYRQGDCATGTVVATRVDRRSRSARPRTGRPSPRSTRPRRPRTPRSTRASSRARPASSGRGRSRARPPATTTCRRSPATASACGSTESCVVDNWRQAWLPWWDDGAPDAGARASGTRFASSGGARTTRRTLRLKWKTPPRSPYTSLWSEVGDGIDYYFVYGPDLDDVVAGYRELTGRAPLMPRWALGLWQSRERYQTAQESLDTLAEFRRRGIPMDTIVQDWQYWKARPVGLARVRPRALPRPRRLDPRDPRPLPRPADDLGLAEVLHDHRELPRDEGEGLPVSGDAEAPDQGLAGLRAHVLRRVQPRGAEALLEADERARSSARAWTPGGWTPRSRSWWARARRARSRRPCTRPRSARAPAWPTPSPWSTARPCTRASGSADPDKRVFILTRSAFAGSSATPPPPGRATSRPTGTACASRSRPGSTWRSPACPGGPPTWAASRCRAVVGAATRGREDVEEWRELVTRWFQYSTFCPLLRVHGQFPNREMWFFGGDEGHRAYTTQLCVRPAPLPACCRTRTRWPPT